MLKLIKIYSDPAIGFPWWGKHGSTILITKSKDRGFGIWLNHRDYRIPSLSISVYYTIEFEYKRYCN